MRKKCEHGRRKSCCVDCGGGSICEHSRIRSQCKDCGGASICEHLRERSKCKECKGSSICKHSQIRSSCKDCGGSSICEHSRQRSQCKDCGGASVCQHSRIRSRCKDCGGSSICEHSRVRSQCKDCKGGSICEHLKRRSRCIDCGGSALCITPFCEVSKHKIYKPYCFRCFVFMNPESPLTRNFKTKEVATRDFILAQFPGLTWICDKTIPDGCSLRRSDLSLDLGDHMLYLEIDEDEHQFGYTCQSKRLCELWQDGGQKPTIFIRFNPDKYTDSNDSKIPGCWKKNSHGLCVIKDAITWNNRLLALQKVVAHYIANIPEKSIEIVTLFFSSASKRDVDKRPNCGDENTCELHPKRPKIA